MLFHSKPNVKSICHRVGVANICFSTGFACQDTRKRREKVSASPRRNFFGGR